MKQKLKDIEELMLGLCRGNLLQALKRVEVNNPVIMLDEIDKLGRSYQGDPSSALLEVLILSKTQPLLITILDVPFDLSKVLFIATANYIGEIPEALT
jgi:ATP-dependent Lon protease